MQKIRAAFESIRDAREAVDRLKSMGYKNAHLDMAENFHVEFAQEPNVSIPGSSPDLLAIASKSQRNKHRRNSTLLNASNPMSGGFDPYHELPVPLSTHLLVTVEDENMDEVKKLIHETGGAI